MMSFKIASLKLFDKETSCRWFWTSWHSRDITVLANKVIILKEYRKIKVKQGDICYAWLHNIGRISSCTDRLRNLQKDKKNKINKAMCVMPRYGKYMIWVDWTAGAQFDEKKNNTNYLKI